MRAKFFSAIISLSLLSFLAGPVALAQTVSPPQPPPEAYLVMETTGYSAISLSTYNFHGHYFMGNYPWRRNTGVTVYFEYAKVAKDFTISSEDALNAIFGREDVKKTAEMKYPGEHVQPFVTDNIDEQEEFTIMQELQSFSRYIFRAVGQFSDRPHEKFYGNAIFLDLGRIPFGPGPTPPTVTISASPRVVPYGGTTTLSWHSTNATSCVLRSLYGSSVFSEDVVDTTGKRLVSLQRPGEVIFVIECTGRGGEAKSGVVIRTQKQLVNGAWNRDFDNDKNSWWNPPDCDKIPCGQRCFQVRTRECNNPAPSGGGKYCEGEASEFRLSVGTKDCPVDAASPTETGKKSDSGLSIPCEGTNCRFEHLVDLVNSVVNFLLKVLLIPIVAVTSLYAGFLLVTSGGETAKRDKAIKLFKNLGIGILLVAGAFIIIKTLLTLAGVDTEWDWFGLVS